MRLTLLILLTLPSLTGCYLLQAAGGQMQIVARREPIVEVVADKHTDPKLRARLQYVTAARDFASEHLGLPDNDSYRSYADLGRSYVVWNVFATPEFSVKPRRWCFPIAGCVVYRGYFKERSAERYALRLRMRGDDAIVGGVAAYSTLGHFKDPVLNTMMGWGDAQLAGTLFHELAHQLVYIPGDSQFNEAFATFVEETGLKRWLQFTGRGELLASWQAQRGRSQDFVELLLQTRQRLQVLYEASLEPRQMRWRKLEEFGRLKFEYWQLRQRWNGYAGYDRWFDRALNNADLVTAATYHGCIPGFRRLFESVNGELPRFYEDVRKVAQRPKAVRSEQLCSSGDGVME